MRSFKTPSYTIADVNKWKKNVPEYLRDPENLKDYWFRYNTLQMQMLRVDDTAFLYEAIAIAKRSSNKNDFEEQLKRRIDQQWAHVREWYTKFKPKVWGTDCESFPCEIARLDVSTFCKTGSLESLLHILDGVAGGWEAKKGIRVAANFRAPRSDNGLDYDFDDPSDFGTTYIGNMLFFRDEMTPFELSEDSSVEDSSDEDTSVADRQTPEAPNDKPESFSSWLRREEEKRAKKAERKRKKRARFNDTAAAETENPPKKRVRVDDAAAAEGVASGPRIEKRARDPDDPDASNDSDASDGRQHKRQRVKRWASSTPTSVISVIPSDDPPTDHEHEHPNATPEPAVVENTPKKRSRTADEDDDNEQYRHKRRRTETPESVPTPRISPPTQQTADECKEDNDNEKRQHKRSRIETPESAPTRQATDESTTVAKANVDDKAKGSRKARSTRSAKSSTFWELDNTSSPRLTRKKRC